MKGYPRHANCSRLVKTPIGGLVLLASDDGLAGLFFQHRVDPEELPADDACNRFLKLAQSQLKEYFAGKRTVFDVPLDVRGTAFQRSVWNELSRIPFGVTRSYAEIAESIGRPKSVRAVGAANGSNPISVIVPCHRVIGADGSLTGFGGGLDLKRSLLELEGVLLAVGAK